MREYRAKFPSLFSALERRSRDDDSQMTVQEALPEQARYLRPPPRTHVHARAGTRSAAYLPLLLEQAAEDTAWGPQAARQEDEVAAAAKASRLDELLAFLLQARCFPPLPCPPPHSQRPPLPARSHAPFCGFDQNIRYCFSESQCAGCSTAA